MKGYDEKTGIWTIETAKKKHLHDAALAGSIFMLYKPQDLSIVDIGCGDGWYCKFLKDLGCKDVKGIEGTLGVSKLGYFRDIKRADLSKKMIIRKSYDLTLCLEVGEHIPPEHENTFLDNVAALTKGTLIMSWGRPGQTGTGHMNCRPQEHVIKQLEHRGFEYNGKESKILGRHSWFKWFHKNMMVFKKVNG